MNRENTVLLNKGELDKAIHTLEGILKGISIDSRINIDEMNELEAWCYMNYHFIDRQPYKELIPFIEEAVSDEYLDAEEQASILWYCRRFSSENSYYDEATSDLQRLQGMMHGILADGRVTAEELSELGGWLSGNGHLRHIYPYDELVKIIEDVLEDGVVDRSEHEQLKIFFADHIIPAKYGSLDRKALADYKRRISISSLCEKTPEIAFGNRTFCLTGKSSRAERSRLIEIIEKRDGIYRGKLSEKTDYLVIGDNGNPYWVYSCYGRKVEQAVAMNKGGASIKLALEKDFWDAAGCLN